MAPLIFALALLAQDAPAPEASPDGPVATAVPRKQTVAPLPIQGGPVTPPTDDYGYVGWCYGAMSGYVELYDRAMPEVIRIERAWPTPSTEENIREVYPAQREEAKRNLALFARAMEAAEKASPTPLQAQGAAAIRRGRGVWTGSGNVPKAQLAQFWMSWSPPAKCEETARALETRSNLFGQALSYNASDAAPVAPPPPGDPAAPGVTSDGPVATLTDVPATTTDQEPAAGLAPEAPAETAPVAETVTITSTDGPTETGDLPVVAVDRLPSGDAESDADMATTDEAPLDEAGEPAADPAATPAPEPEASGDPSEPASVLDAAALSAGAPEAVGQTVTIDADPDRVPAPSTDGIAEAPATAIDDLLPAEQAPAEPVAAEPAPPAAREQPATPKRKRGLKDTLMGLKGPQ